MGEILRLFVSETTLFVFPSSGGPDELFEVVHCLLVKRKFAVAFQVVEARTFICALAACAELYI